MKALAGSSTAISLPASPASSAAPPKRFALSGPSARPDPRINAFRADLADIAIADRIFAPHYAQAERCFCIVPSAMLRAAPCATSPAVSQILYGEAFEMLDRNGDWAWGRTAYDDYVGYLPANVLGMAEAPTYRVVAPSALLFAQAAIKSVATPLPIGACLTGIEQGDFLATSAGFVHRRHVAPIAERAPDPVAVAERLIGMPYLWGGRGANGIDCSGLAQLALSFAGIAAPRDSDQQRQLGHALSDDAPLRRGDLVFFPGHVGMMASAHDMIHANAYWMAVTIEPLADIVARLAPDHAAPVLARRRLPA